MLHYFSLNFIFFWWKIYSFPFTFIYKRFNICYCLSIFSYFSWLNASVIAYWKHLLFFYWWDLLLPFCILSSQANLIMIHHKLFWYLFLNESKTYFINSCAPLLIMIFMLSFSECITGSSSLSMEELKLFAVVRLW